MWRDVVDVVMRGFAERLAHFGPNLVAMAVVVLGGLAAAVLLRLGVRAALPRLGFDRFSERIGLSAVLERGGVGQAPSGVVAAFTMWTVVCLAVLFGVAALDLQIAMNLLSRAFEYLPQLLIAVAILAAGALISGFLRRSVLIAAVNADLPSARLLAGGVHTALMILFAAMALEHLGVGRQILLVSFTILFGGVVFALSLAFGMAGRELAREFLDGLRQRPPREEQDPLRHL